MRKVQSFFWVLIPLIFICFASTYKLGQGSSCSQPPTSGYFNKYHYLPTGEIKVGQGRLWEVWKLSLDAYIPRNRKTWAMAMAHAYQIFRNVAGDNIVPIQIYFATAIKESFSGCDPFAEDPENAKYRISNQSRSLKDGCFQLRGNQSAYAELHKMYPHRFPKSAHSKIAGGSNFETACISKAYYDIFTLKFLEYVRGWEPLEFFKEAKDTMAAVKLISAAYNRGLWSTFIKDVLVSKRSEVLKADDVVSFVPGRITKDYAASINRYVQVLGNHTESLPDKLKKVNTATGKAYNYFDGYFDEEITWEDVKSYLNQIHKLYPGVNWLVVQNNLKYVFDEINNGSQISFRYDFGRILDSLLVQLPYDDPTYNAIYYYGCKGKWETEYLKNKKQRTVFVYFDRRRTAAQSSLIIENLSRKKNVKVQMISSNGKPSISVHKGLLYTGKFEYPLFKQMNESGVYFIHVMYNGKHIIIKQLV